MEDNIQYWIDRHSRYANRLASVGDLRRTEEENITLYAEKKREVFDILRALEMSDLRGATVLDAGCGTGLITELLWAMGAEVSGVDASPEALRQAALRAPSGSFLESPLTALDLRREYDIVLCADVLYHLIENEAWRLTIEKLARHLKRGGYLIILEQLRQQEEMPAAHVHFRNLLEYRSVLRNMGLLEREVGNPARCLVWYLP